MTESWLNLASYERNGFCGWNARRSVVESRWCAELSHSGVKRYGMCCQPTCFIINQLGQGIDCPATCTVSYTVILWSFWHKHGVGTIADQRHGADKETWGSSAKPTVQEVRTDRKLPPVPSWSGKEKGGGFGTLNQESKATAAWGLARHNSTQRQTDSRQTGFDTLRDRKDMDDMNGVRGTGAVDS